MANPEIEEQMESYSNEQLISLLKVSEDQLPREIIDECIGRGDKIIPMLKELIDDDLNWPMDRTGWAVIHATNILGAIDEPATINPLLTSMQKANSNWYQDLWQNLPSMFRIKGVAAIHPLREVVAFDAYGDREKSIALQCLAAMTIKEPSRQGDAFGIVADTLKDEGVSRPVRRIAGEVLLDFRKKEFTDELVEFAVDEERLINKVKNYPPRFTRGYVKEMLSETEDNVAPYTHDWLEQYEKAVMTPQEKWEKEHG